MAALPPVKIRYSYERDWPGTWQPQGVGAQASPYRRGWYPQLPETDGAVSAFCRVKKWLYVGGSFATVGGEAIPNLFRMNLEDGSVDASFRPTPDGQVLALATDGSLLYIGGDFEDIGEGTPLSASRLARLTAAGVLDPGWLPQANGAVLVLACKTGTSNVYAGGAFSNIGTDARLGLAEIDGEGVATLFDAQLNGTAEALAYSLAQNALYVGGSFSMSAASTRNNICRVDGDTGTADSWDPDANDEVKAIALDYPRVYAGGRFTTIGGGSRDYIACLDQTAAATAFDPSPDLYVYSISTMGDKVFFGGVFTGALRGVDQGGVDLPWDPAPAGLGVNTVFCYKSTVFAGGSLTSVNGIGSTTVSVGGCASIPFPLFRDDNTIFVKQTGLYQNAGTGAYADPKRDMDGVLGTSPTFADQSAAGNNLTMTGTVQYQYDGWTKPGKGHWMAGLFTDSDYLTVPAAVGTAIAASNAFTAQFEVWVESLAAINMVWDYQDAAQDTKVFINTNGSVTFRLRGSDSTSAAGVVTARGWYVIKVEKNPSGNLKRVWAARKGAETLPLVINTTQAATMGAHASNRLFKDRSNVGQWLVGFGGPVIFLDSAPGGDAPLTWRDSYSGDCIGYWPMQTKSAIEGDPGMFYCCVLDSGTYEEQFTWHADGCSLYAADGCAPTFRPRIGAKPGTYGARVAGREKFSSGAGSTFIYVSKAGDDATGARGNPDLPFRTFAGAFAAAGITAGDTVQVQDSGVYTENISAPVALTVQAADGEVPTLRQATPSGVFIAGAVSFYGMFIKGDLSSTGANATYTPTAGVEWYDCSIDHLWMACSVASATYVVDSCSCVNFVASLGGGWSFTGTGSFRARNTYLAAGSIIRGAGKFSIVQKCTGVQSTAANAPAVFRVGTTTGSGCFSLALECHATLINQGTPSNFDDGGFFVGGGQLSNSLGYNFSCAHSCTVSWESSGTSVGFQTGSSAIAANAVYCVEAVVNCRADATGASTAAYPYSMALIANVSTFSVWQATRNVLVLGNPDSANMNYSFVDLEVGGGSIGAGSRHQARNCTSLNAGVYGFDFGQHALPASIAGVYWVEGLLDEGSAGGVVATSALTVNYGTFSTIGANISGVGLLAADALCISSVEGVENAALSAGSPGLFNGDALGVSDQGTNWAWLVSQAPGATLAGFRVAGDVNLGAGLRNDSGAAMSAEFLTFEGLGLAGLHGREGASAHYCAGDATNGPAFRMGGVSAVAERSAAWSCAGAAFVFGAPDLQADHCSSWGCEYGHSDSASATGVLQDSIHSDNGTDAQANEAVAWSDVGTVGAGTVVAATSTRLNPLYRDPFSGDLRLQTTEAGYPHDSPAKGTASDGGDMGAWEAEYGPLSESFIELDLNQPSTDPNFTVWRNPDDVPWELVPIKLSEGEKPLGGSYSSAKAVKRQWTLKWKPDNDMPPDQLIALNEVYAAPGKVAVAFDGCTFIDCVVLKSNAARNDQIDGLYTDSNVPRPLESLVLREL